MKRLLLLVALFLGIGQGLYSQDFNLELKSTMNFPGQTLANICGYTQDGREYALLGASKGMVIVDITDPVNPVNIVQIPGPDDLWKEIKTFSHYAYITSEGGGGVQIVDLSNLPSASLAYHNYNGNGAINNQLNTIHALHIDGSKGFLYAYGSNLFNGGAVVLDLNADPYNPTYAGKYDQLNYIHDGYADNDTLYGSHIYSGLLSIVDMSNKANPVLLGTVQTPGKFTHNNWLLDDHKHILTTDETTPSFLASYDITDPSDIQELDRFSPNDGYGTYVHNTHVLNDWAITSWYTDGFTIVDAHKPDNLVITGMYDTYPGDLLAFEGCWGVYPFFPSGTIVASNIEPGELFVLTPTYLRACYVEGSILDGCNGQGLNGATISINSGNAWFETKTKNDGSFKTGQWETGTYVVSVSKPGYETQEIPVTLVAGEVAPISITLSPMNAVDVTGTVYNAETGLPIPNALLVLNGSGGNATNLATNPNGQFSISCFQGGHYQAFIGAWGYLPNDDVLVTGNGATDFSLEPGYYDDFYFDYGWTSTSTASSGAWEGGEPQGTTYGNDYSNPEFDLDFDSNDRCFVTGNGGGNAGSDDVDNGEVTLTSPAMQLSGYDDAVLSFYYWFFNEGGQGNPDDKLTVKLSNGTQTVTVFEQAFSDPQWRYSGAIPLNAFMPLSNNMRVLFITSDNANTPHLVEAGVDVFRVSPVRTSATNETIDASAKIIVSPNPSRTGFQVGFDWPNAANVQVDVFNTMGQKVYEQALGAQQSQVKIAPFAQDGIYFLRLKSDSGYSKTVRLVQ